jgi:hypothetical protein
MTAPLIGRTVFRAGPDRVGHAVRPRGRVTHTACGLPATSEALAWPPRTRCPRCLQVIGLVPFGDPEDVA